MQPDNDPSNRAPRRWMAWLLALLAVGGVAMALTWSHIAEAAPDVSSALDVKCEMVQVWPLPAECLFVFNASPASGPAVTRVAAR